MEKVVEMTGKFFSIIVPVYNAEDSLKKCITSVINQSFDDFELILVDDGSKDTSPLICDFYAKNDERIQVIHQVNSGQTNARKRGLKKSVGRYVVFLDSDDWLDENTLKKCFDYLNINQVDVLAFGYKECRNGKEKEIISFLEKGYYDKNAIDKDIIPNLMMNRNGGFFPRALWAKVFERNIIEKNINSVPEIIRNGEDMCCVVSTMLEANSLYIINDPLYFYKVDNDTSVSKSGDALALKRCKVMTQFLKRIIEGREQELEEQYRRLVLQQIYSAVVRTISSIGTGGAFKQEFNELMREKLCETAVQKAKFSAKAKKLIVKQFILKHKIFWIVKYI